MKKNGRVKVEESDLQQSKGRKAAEQYKCGDPNCGKIYHSYTAFYNHCKKSHGGQFPKSSLYNDKLFQGPTKNRGRPRIKKNEAKDLVQIESMKKQNQLIEFMGTLDRKKSQQLIVYVENPIQRVKDAVIQVKQWLRRFMAGPLQEEDLQYLAYLQRFNQIISNNDLPQFYDPIQTANYPDNLDSYSFSNVYDFMTRNDMRQKFNIKLEGKQLLFKIYLCWSARMLSQALFNQVLYLVMQLQKDRYDRKDLISSQKDALKLLFEKKYKLKELISSFFDCLMKEHDRGGNEKSNGEKKEKGSAIPTGKEISKKKNNYMADKHFASDQGNQEEDEEVELDEAQDNDAEEN